MKKPAAKKRPAQKPKKPPGGSDVGCKYVQQWSPLKSTRGFVQVWVPEKTYEKAAKAMLKTTRDRYARSMLRQKTAPLALTSVCTGKCPGGFCKEIQMGPNAFVCDCTYFV